MLPCSQAFRVQHRGPESALSLTLIPALPLKWIVQTLKFGLRELGVIEIS